MATLGVAASSALLKPVITKLSSEAWKNMSMFWQIDRKCETLKNMLLTISTVLADAEKKSITDELIRHWLLQLQDVAYDIDDLMDDMKIEAQRRDQNKSFFKPVQNFFSSDNQVKFRANKVKRLKKITKRMGKIMVEKKNFELVEGDVLMEEDRTERVTTSAVNESKVYGRNKEKEILVEHLIRGKYDETLSVLPIVGMGGVGKTTLAQIICEDPEITGHFKRIIWVHVPMNFELSKILQNLVECSGEKCDVSEKEAMKNKIQAVISKTKFLVVLDDVWNEDAKKWEDLETILSCGDAGSKILVTTRSKKIAELMGTFEPFYLKPLEFEHCWELFKQRAFRQIKEDENAVHIGKEIVKKCEGLPLAAKHLGNIAGSGEVDWSVIRDNEIWQIEECIGGIVSSLLLSYFYLPSHLKRCFAYCSLFPKGFLFKKKYLIQLWVCEGFIPESKRPADFSFNYLLSRSFFEEVEEIGWKGSLIVDYKMHDLIHDLACYVAGNKFFLRSESESSQNTVISRYSSLISNDVIGMMKLRTLLYRSHKDFETKSNSIMQMQFLRVLDLNCNKIEVLPESIGNLRHLRYLNLSNNFLIMLPNSVTDLLSLEVLDLSWCWKLTMLPDGLGTLEKLEVLNLSDCNALEKLPTSLCSLANLRVLNLTGCNKLVSIPKGIGRLTKLERLPFLIIGGEEGCNFGELEQLNLLHDDLQVVVKEKWGIQGIKNPKLETKKNLKSLELKVDECVESDVELKSQIKILILPPQLENLSIQFKNGGLPSSLRNNNFHIIYRILVNVQLHGINECECFPQFGQLPRLKLLHLSLLFPITGIKEQFSGNCGIYPVLEELELSVRYWVCNVIVPEEAVVETEAMKMMFPYLKKVTLWDCPFTSVFPFLPRNIEDLTIEFDCGDQVLSARCLQELYQLRKLKLFSLRPIDISVFDGWRHLTALDRLWWFLLPAHMVRPLHLFFFYVL